MTDMNKPTHWTVTNIRTGEVRKFKSGAAATRSADRQDMAYGAICTRRKAHWPEENTARLESAFA